MAFDLRRIDISAAGGHVDAGIFRHIDFQSNPEPSGTLALRPLGFQEHAVGRRVRGDREAFQQLLSVLLGSVGFQMNVPIQFVHVAEFCVWIEILPRSVFTLMWSPSCTPIEPRKSDVRRLSR